MKQNYTLEWTLEEKNIFHFLLKNSIWKATRALDYLHKVLEYDGTLSGSHTHIMQRMIVTLNHTNDSTHHLDYMLSLQC